MERQRKRATGRPKAAAAQNVVQLATRKGGARKGVKQATYRHHSVEEIAEALKDAKGMITIAAEMLEISQQAVRQRINNEPVLQAGLVEAREAMKDRAEMRLYDSIEAREAWAVCFYLKTQARDRGYIERQELANVPGEEFQVAIQAVPWKTALAAFMPPSEDMQAIQDAEDA